MEQTHRIIRLVADDFDPLILLKHDVSLPVPKVARHEGRIFLHVRTDRYTPGIGEVEETATFKIADVLDAATLDQVSL